MYEQSQELQSLEQFLKFLEIRFQALETLIDKTVSKPPSQRTSTRSLATSATATTASSASCPCCKGTQHQLYHCSEFLRMLPSAREQFVRRAKLCLNCLRPNHRSVDCKSRLCLKCNKGHNTLLHHDTQPQPQPMHSTTRTSKNTTADSSTSSSTTASAHQMKDSSLQNNAAGYVILGTAMILLKANGQKIKCRALLDSGSQLNLITSKIFSTLGLNSRNQNTTIIGVGHSKQRSSKRVNVSMESLNNGYSAEFEARVLDKIVPQQPAQHIDISRWKIPHNIKLADPEFHLPKEVDVLIGAEFYHHLLTSGQICLGSELPVLQNTLFGWIVAGKIKTDTSTDLLCGINVEDNLDEALERFWKLEEKGEPQKQFLTPPERQCETYFCKTVQRKSDGRFIVKLPFREDPRLLGDSKQAAMRRFLAMERRLQREESLKRQYVKFMDEYIGLGHMEEVSCIPKNHFFLPHHAVLKPDSTTTKLRVVFDASAKTTTNLSLNDIQHTGQKLQNDLFSTLLRFRLPRFVFTADIEKMYRQILVNNDDQCYQLIYWRSDPTKPVKCYKLRTVTYGTSSAPYLAIRCLLQLAKIEERMHPVGAACIREDFYVDDVMTGSNSLIDAIEKKQQLVKILKGAGFNLRKWCSNHPRLLEDINAKDQEVQLDFTDDNDCEIKTLGLSWMPKTDEFHIKAIVQERNKITKRTIASDVASLFDPLGVMAPVIIKAKLFLQQLWELKIDWDAALPLYLITEWTAFRSELRVLNEIKIPRQLFNNHAPNNIQLHGFSDASERAFGAAIYTRSISRQGSVIVRLLCAKSKVAPTKKVTLPRLELCAAKLVAELMDRVRGFLKLTQDVPTYLWTDSEIVLAWINSSSSEFHTFVANRIASIHENSIPSQWRHVRSNENPADIISRGTTPTVLRDHNMWFYGPRFLHASETLWPEPYHAKQPATLEHKRSTTLAALDHTEASKNFVIITEDILNNINHKNSFKMVINIVGYVLRFVNKVRKVETSTQKTLSVSERHQALTLIIKHMQSAEFKQDIIDLSKGRELSKSSPLGRLSPFQDENGVLRVTGRVQASNLSYESKHPKIIPYRHEYTNMMMREIHIENHHVGEHALVKMALDRGLWIMKAKNVARSVLKKCIRCVRSKPNLYTQIMGNLPKDRVQPARPFVNAGVDFCGPVWVHYKIRGKRPQKSYVAVFCCFPTKAVHLELVSDLTTNAFVGALKRFIGRRGHCRNLYCDNATNFVGARNQLQELQETIYSDTAKSKIFGTCIDKGIDFHFIPPRAPHFGGLWEAAVKSAKTLLIKSVHSATLTYEELETVIIEIEAILNSRPLTPMSPDPSDLTALTPGHFLIGEALTSNIDPIAKEQKSNLLARWHLVTHIKQEFWRRWSREYLHELQQRQKWHKSVTNVKPDTMVLIKEDNVSSMHWPLGRIIEVYKGEDGFVRVADVRTVNGVLRRPIHRLAPLLIEEKETPDFEPSAHKKLEETQKEHVMGPATKRSRLGSLLLSTLFILSIFGSGNCNYQTQQLQAGLYIENLGVTHLRRGALRAEVSFSQHNFNSDKTAINNMVSGTNQLCEMSTSIHNCSHCINLIVQLRQKESHLIDDIDMLTAQFKRRQRRGLIGTILQAVYGVNDDVYRELDKLHEDQSKVTQIANHQTSILVSTVAYMNTTEARVSSQMDDFKQRLEKGLKTIQSLKKSVHAIDMITVEINFLMVFHAVENALNSYTEKYDHLHRVITKHRDFEQIISIRDFNNLIEKATSKLPSNLIINRSSNKLVEVRLNASVLTVYGFFDILEAQSYQLMKITPVPHAVNNTEYQIMWFPNNIVAVDYTNQAYFELSESELRSCTKTTNKTTWMCLPPAISKITDNSSCVIDEIFQRHTRSPCPVIEMTVTGILWRKLYLKNTWMFTTPKTTSAALYCDAIRTDLSLRGVGLLSFDENCRLETSQWIIKSEISTEFTVLESHYKPVNVSALPGLLDDRTMEEEPSVLTSNVVLKPSDTIISQAINELTIMQQNQNHMLWSRSLRHSQHTSWAIALSALILTTLIAVIIAFAWCHKHKRSQQVRHPVPATRTIKTSNSTPMTVVTDQVVHQTTALSAGDDIKAVEPAAQRGGEWCSKREIFECYTE